MQGIFIVPLGLIGTFTALIFSLAHHENRPPPDTPLIAYAAVPEDTAHNSAAFVLNLPTPTPPPTPVPTPEPPPPPPPAPRVVVTAVPVVRAQPTTAPRVQPPPQEQRVVAHSVGSLYALVAAYFPEQPDFAYFVMMCESGGNPTVFNGAAHWGLWQFDVRTWGGAFGVTNPAHATPEQQTARAREVYLQRGWQPWQAATEPWRCPNR